MFSIPLGWPFVAVVALPLALDAICTTGLMSFMRHSVCAAGALLLPSVMIDTWLYGRFVIAAINILLYNSSTSSTSDFAIAD